MKTARNNTCLFSLQRTSTNAARLWLLPLALSTALFVGCATHSAKKTSEAHANTGYVDFSAEGPGDTVWRIARYDDQKKEFKGVSAKAVYPYNGVMRLEFPPGRHHLRITPVNRYVTKPAEVDVEVLLGYVTSVEVKFTDAHISAMFPQYYDPLTITETRDSLTYGMAARAGTPIAYEAKEPVTYAHY